jgi:hypothetical protein
VGPTRLSYARSMTFQSSSKFLPGSRLASGSLLFIANQMGDLSLSEPASREIVGSGTDRVHLIPTRDGLAYEAQLGHKTCLSAESELDPSMDNTDHHKVCCPTTTYPIYKPSPEFDSDNGQVVFMVGLGEPPADQTLEEIA